MPAHAFRLSDPTAAALKRLRTALDHERTDHRDAFDERSERWQTGDVGSEVDAWLDHLDGVFDTLDEVETRRSDDLHPLADGRPDLVELRKLIADAAREVDGADDEDGEGPVTARLDDTAAERIAAAVLARVP